MNRHIPISPESINVICIPPIRIEMTISKLQQLSHQIQKWMKHYIKHTEPRQVVWNLKNNACNRIKKHKNSIWIIITANFSNRSVAFVTSILLNGIKEFFTDGIIYCCMTAKIICIPTTTSNILFNRNRFRILWVLGKFNS